MNLSLFKTGTPANPCGTITLANLFSEIRDGAHRMAVERVRKAITDWKPDAYMRQLKCDSLQSVCVSGVVVEGGRKQAMQEGRFNHNGLMQIDLDKLENPVDVRDMLASDPHVICSFLSPSGQGVKAVAVVEKCGEVKDHRAAWLTCEKYFLDLYGLQIDNSTKDPSRLCFVSYDPEAKWNDEAQELPTTEAPPEPVRNPSPPASHRKRDLSELTSMLAPMPERLDYDSWLRVCSGVWNEYGEEYHYFLDSFRWKAPSFTWQRKTDGLRDQARMTKTRSRKTCFRCLLEQSHMKMLGILSFLSSLHIIGFLSGTINFVRSCRHPPRERSSHHWNRSDL